MDFLYLIFYRCLRLRFLDVETNPGPRRPVPAVCRILCSDVRGLAANFSDLTIASSQYDILLCSETLVPDMRHVSEVLVPGFCRPVVLCWGKMPRARGMAAYVRDGYGAFRQTKFECGCCEMLIFRVCGVRQNLYVVLSKRQFSDRNRDVLMNVQSPHKWWSTLKSALCLDKVHHCRRSIVRVVDWCVSRLVRLTCCRIILTASCPGRLLIYRSLVIHLLVLPLLRFGRVR